MLKISVITINRNNREGLTRTMDSVSKQAVRPFEYIVVDGASTDGSEVLVKERKDVVNLFISEKDEGIYDAMNKGIDRCTGDYVYFLNSGDEFYSDSVIERLNSEKADSDLIYGNMIWKSSGKQMVPPLQLDVPLFVLGTLWHPCVLVKRSVFLTYGPFNKSFRITGDYEFLLRVLIRYGISYRYINIDISLYDTTGISNSPGQADLESRERQQSWDLNFSGPVREAMFDYVKTLRSSELKWGKRIRRFFK